MTVTQTTAERILAQVRSEAGADSSLYGGRLLRGDAARGGPGFSDLLTAARRGPAAEHELLLGLEFIFEGFLLHYGVSRVLKPDTIEFKLLAGDYMYAKGLVHVASLDDLFPISALADLLRFCAFIHGEGWDPALALDGWAMTTLLLASDGSRGGGRTSLSEMTWGRSGEAPHSARVGTMLRETAAACSSGSPELIGLIDDIYTNFQPEA